MDASKNPSRGTVIASAPGDGMECPDHIKALWRAGEVVLSWSYTRPIKQLSTSGLAKVRTARLRRRLERDVPLFADEIFRQQLEKKPEFYAGAR